MLLAYATTKTNAESGLEQVFNDLEDDIRSQVLLFASILLSFLTCANSHVKGCLKTREKLPFKSKLILILFATCSIVQRVFSIIILLTHPLGLFDCLGHYQNSRVPYAEGENF